MLILVGRAGASAVSGHRLRSQELLYLGGGSLTKNKVGFLNDLGDWEFKTEIKSIFIDMK